MNRNMMTTSDVVDFSFKELESKCEEHGIHLVEFYGKEICPTCAKQLTDTHEKKLIEQETKKHYRKDKDYIKRSILSDNTLKLSEFDTYKVVDEETKENKMKARLLAGAYLKGATFNTVFTGKVGTGKSHLAMSMLRAVNEHSEPYRKCLFVSVDELISLLRYSYTNNETQTENQLRNLCVEADLLVLDDLGAEVGSIKTEKDASNDVVRMINAIVTGRMDKPTIFTSNLSSKRIRGMYDDRIASRVLKGTNKDRTIIFTKTKDKRNKYEF